MVPVSRAGEEEVGWREVVEVEVFFVGGAGGLCHGEGVGVGVFASMSMVVVVLGFGRRTKWSVMGNFFFFFFFLSRFLLESLGGISVYVYITSPYFFFLFLFLFLFLFFFLSSLLHPTTRRKGKKKARRSKVEKKDKKVKSSISRPYTDPSDKKKASQVYIYNIQQQISRG